MHDPGSGIKPGGACWMQRPTDLDAPAGRLHTASPYNPSLAPAPDALNVVASPSRQAAGSKETAMPATLTNEERTEALASLPRGQPVTGRDAIVRR